MPNFKGLMKDTAIYGISSIVGRFLNYLLVPLLTYSMPKETGDYGASVQMYAFTAFCLTILTFGMETSLFRFANQPGRKPDTVFSTGLAMIGSLTALYLIIVWSCLGPLSRVLGYADHPEYISIMATVTALDALQALPFCYLRFQKRAIKFASLKMIFVVFNILFNVLFYGVLHHTEVIYVFVVNLCCTAAITFFFVPDLRRIEWHFDRGLLREMLSYSWPILLLGVAGVLNQVADKMIFPLVWPGEDGLAQVGEYGACFRIAMVMAMILQAFRFAYEPIVFAKNSSSDSDEDKRRYYADAMKWFVIFSLAAALAVVALLDWIQYFIDADYRGGLRVVPIVMAAEIMMGIYFNLSFWYKLIDKTIYGAWFSIAGCVVLLAVNFWGIPQYSYMACAWAGFAGYGTCMLLSYIFGQRINPIPYEMKTILGYVLLAGVLYWLMTLVPWQGWVAVCSKMGLLVVYLLAVLFSLRQLWLKKMK
ncbi:MAG: lipopolysaccharide biosynthesis protein [Bacteroidales bacterium]|nr:lipopolysaccharide biosynthesis protein [Bacteroidales bacterium]